MSAADVIINMAASRAIAYAKRHGVGPAEAVSWVVTQMYVAPHNEYKVLDIVCDVLFGVTKEHS